MAERQRDLELNTAMENIGFGKFQVAMFALLFPVAMFHGARMTSSYFFMLDEGHRCAIPGDDNDTYDVTTDTQELLYNRSIPEDDFCHIFISGPNTTYDDNHRPVNGIREKCNRWVYKHDVLSENAVTQLDLVCDNSLLKTHAAMFLYLGSLLGATLLGMFSDRFGRRACLLLSVTLLLPCGIGLPWVHHFYTLAILQFIIGAASTGMFASALVMGLELVQPELRKYPGLIPIMFFALGEFLLAASFKGLHDWHWVSIIITAPTAFFLLYYWLVPESLRWLMMRKKYDQVSKVLNRMAKSNKRDLPHLNGLDPERDLESLLKSYEREDQFSVVIRTRDSFLDLFKNCLLCRRTLTICINWLIVNLLFYGFTLNSSNLKALNKYVSFSIGAAVELPADLLTLLLIDKLGRRPVHCGMLLLTAVVSFAAVGVAVEKEHQWIVAMLSMLGKFGASGLMATSFLWMTELFPVSVRSTGLGVGSSCARAGAIAAPYIVHSSAKMSPQNVGVALPFIVFGVAAFINLVLCFGLPETSRRDLPETVEEAKYFGRNTRRDERPPSNGAIINYYGALDIH